MSTAAFRQSASFARAKFVHESDGGQSTRTRLWSPTRYRVTGKNPESQPNSHRNTLLNLRDIKDLPIEFLVRETGNFSSEQPIATSLQGSFSKDLGKRVKPLAAPGSQGLIFAGPALASNPNGGGRPRTKNE